VAARGKSLFSADFNAAKDSRLNRVSPDLVLTRHYRQVDVGGFITLHRVYCLSGV
jgi:hypothetical protein